MQLNTVFGNVLKELWNRLVVMILLLFVFLEWITKIEVIYYLTYAYILRTIVMMCYAFTGYMPTFELKLPENGAASRKYSAYRL